MIARLEKSGMTGNVGFEAFQPPKEKATGGRRQAERPAWNEATGCCRMEGEAYCNVTAIKTAVTLTISDIKTSLIAAVYGRLYRPTFRLWRNVVNRHKYR